MKRFHPDPALGLKNEQVLLMHQQRATNTYTDPATRTMKQIIFANVFTYFNFIFLIITSLLILVGSWGDLISFLPILAANSLIGILQELRAKKTLDDLKLLHAPKSAVIRNGKKQILPADHLVLDDIVLFSAGSQIPADAIVARGTVSVNESLLTGEPDEIAKHPGDELRSGSFIVSGHCLARLERVGADSYISKLTLDATQSDNTEQSEMTRSLDQLLKIIGILIIPIGLLLFIQQYYFSGLLFRDSVTASIAAVIGMIPEGLYLFSSIAMAVSSIRLSQEHVLVHDMKCIETLARVDMLCVDKTGTITQPDMIVNELISFGTYQDTDLSLFQLLSNFASSMSSDNPTINALKEYFTESTNVSPDHTTAFSSACKYSSASFGNRTYVLGAPEFVLRDDYAAYEAEILSHSEEGYRVLAFASYEGIPDGAPLTEKSTLYALLLLSNPIRKEAKQTFHYFAKQGVQVKVLSGDNPATVSKIASDAGIRHADRYIDASRLTCRKDLEQAMLKYTIFGRVSPKQKQMMIQALQSAGHTVAMTGDGVNDILALKDADCSIAMASGSEAATQVAQLVLLESDFSKMPAVVAEGRRVVNNLERTASLFLVKNIFSLLMSIFSVIFMVNYPLEPAQISLISLFTIGIPGFVLSLEPNEDPMEGRFLPNVLRKALPAGLTDFFVVSALVMFCQTFQVDAEDVSTASTVLLAIVGLMILYQICSPMSHRHLMLLISMAAGLLFCMLLISPVFSISGISLKCAMLLLLFAIITEPCLRYLSKLGQLLSKRKNYRSASKK